MTPLIKCEHVDFGYDNQDAVVDVNMEVDAGDYLCIVGETFFNSLVSVFSSWFSVLSRLLVVLALSICCLYKGTSE